MRFSTRLILILAMASLFTSCATNKEEEALAKAQKCLNEVSASNPSAAAACFSLVSDYSSAAANKMKCAIKLTQGGLAEDKVSDAFEILQGNTANKEAAFMAILSLDNPASTGYTLAMDAKDFCGDSGDPGFIYISSLVIAGTAMNRANSVLNSTSDPADVTQVLTDCTTNYSSNQSQCDSLATDLSPVAVTMADAYCAQADADQDVCGTVNEAIASVGGNEENVGKALLCYLNGQSFNSGTGNCTP